MKRKKQGPSKFYVYVICYADRFHEVGMFPAGRIQADGGVEKFESRLSGDASWFHPLGEITISPPGNGDTSLEIAPIRRLLKAWVRSGSPKKFGKRRGDGPSDDRV
jgi:hypothetical protein